MSERPVLYDHAAEAAILGAALINPSVLDELTDDLEPRHFGRAHHALMFEVMRRLHHAGEPVDLVTLIAELTHLGKLDDCGGSAAVARLIDGVPRTTNVAAYARVIRDRYLLRTLRQVGEELARATEADGAKGTDVLADIEQAIFSLTQTAVRTDWVSGAALSQQLYAAIESFSSTGPVSGVPTGFSWVDRLTRGLQPSDLVVLGARPSMGKTSWALQVALHAAKTVPVAFFSVEMALQPIGLRGIATIGQVDSQRLLQGRATSEVELSRVGLALAELAEAKIHLDESPSLSPLQIRSKLRRLRASLGSLGLVVIDYMQLLAPLPEHKRENRATQVAGISRTLKILARELGVPFLVLSQLNRNVEGRADKRPTMADLRESGALEQDADIVFLLHRPAYYDANHPDPALAELIVDKQRNGSTGLIPLTWHPTQLRFESRQLT